MAMSEKLASAAPCFDSVPFLGTFPPPLLPPDTPGLFLQVRALCDIDYLCQSWQEGPEL